MPIDFEPMQSEASTRRGTIFLSGSIPDAERWDGDFDALEITDAVVAFARVCLTKGFRIVTAAHPTLAPLLMYVAAEFPRPDDPQIVIYQSLLFESVLPTATRRFEAEGVGEVVWTEAAGGDEPVPGQWIRSLSAMRQRMLHESDPAAAVFIGGMSGIDDEYRLFTDLYPRRLTYATRRPGGEAARLQVANVSTGTDLEASYPTLWSQFLDRVRL